MARRRARGNPRQRDERDAAAATANAAPTATRAPLRIAAAREGRKLCGSSIGLRELLEREAAQQLGLARRRLRERAARGTPPQMAIEQRRLERRQHAVEPKRYRLTRPFTACRDHHQVRRSMPVQVSLDRRLRKVK